MFWIFLVWGFHLLCLSSEWTLQLSIVQMATVDCFASESPVNNCRLFRLWSYTLTQQILLWNYVCFLLILFLWRTLTHMWKLTSTFFVSLSHPIHIKKEHLSSKGWLEILQQVNQIVSFLISNFSNIRKIRINFNTSCDLQR